MSSADCGSRRGAAKDSVPQGAGTVCVPGHPSRFSSARPHEPSSQRPDHRQGVHVQGAREALARRDCRPHGLSVATAAAAASSARRAASVNSEGFASGISTSPLADHPRSGGWPWGWAGTRAWRRWSGKSGRRRRGPVRPSQCRSHWLWASRLCRQIEYGLNLCLPTSDSGSRCGYAERRDRRTRPPPRPRPQRRRHLSRAGHDRANRHSCDSRAAEGSRRTTRGRWQRKRP